MPTLFFSAFRLAGLNIGLLIFALLILAVLSVLVWRIVRVMFFAALLLLLLPIATFIKLSRVAQEPQTEEERVAHQARAEAARQFWAKALQISDGGRYGRARAIQRRSQARSASGSTARLR